MYWLCFSCLLINNIRSVGRMWNKFNTYNVNTNQTVQLLDCKQNSWNESFAKTEGMVYLWQLMAFVSFTEDSEAYELCSIDLYMLLWIAIFLNCRWLPEEELPVLWRPENRLQRLYWHKKLIQGEQICPLGQGFPHTLADASRFSWQHQHNLKIHKIIFFAQH